VSRTGERSFIMERGDEKTLVFDALFFVGDFVLTDRRLRLAGKRLFGVSLLLRRILLVPLQRLLLAALLL
jgi:hypothetical protein